MAILTKRLTNGQISEIIKLAQAGISLANIAGKFGLNKTTVYYHARNYCRKMTRLHLNLLTEFEKGYLIGFFLGDGSLNRGRKTPRYIVRFALDAKRDQDISARLYQIFQKGRKQTSIFPRDATLIVKVCSKELVDYIQTCVKYKRNQNDQIRKKLLIGKGWSLEFQYGVLAGIIDSDGHVQKHLGTEIKTVSPLVFEGILGILTNLGIGAKTSIGESTKNSFSKKNRYIVYIPSKQVKAFQDKMCSVKMKRLSCLQS